MTLTPICQISYLNNPLILEPQVRQVITENEARLLQFFRQLCQNAQIENPIVLNHLRENADELHTWLSRLDNMADYMNDATKTNLAKFIYQMVKKAEEESAFRETFFSCIEEAAITCGDRMALSVIRLGINYDIDIAKKENNLPHLAYLIGHGSWALNQLEQIAKNKVDSLQRLVDEVDEIEVYLAYPIKLKEKLKLPIRTENMLFFNMSHLTDDDLGRAAEIILPALSDIDEYSKMLADDQVWLDALKTSRPDDYNRIEQEREEAADQLEQEYKEETNQLEQENEEAANRSEQERMEAYNEAYKRINNAHKEDLKELTKREILSFEQRLPFLQ
ncbi:MAG: NEL-type E3 ubiquitin ligase domain-containing protein [Chlamydiales bacterium]